MLIADLLPTMALVVSAAVILAAGVFTIRSNIASTWKENYNAETERRKAETERRKLAEEEAENQRKEKHEALNALAATRLKTDVTQLMALAEDIRGEMNRERIKLERRLRADHADLVKMLQRVLDRIEGEK